MSLIELQNDAGTMRASIAPQAGGELSALAVQHNGEWHELLYRANDFSPPAVWQGRAPLLWPAVGRSFTNEQISTAATSGIEPEMGRYCVNGEELEIACHGFAMSETWECTEAPKMDQPGRAVCELLSGGRFRARYPFDFCLRSEFVLGLNCLQWNMTVLASSDNMSLMPFSVGNHISLRFPFTPKSTWEQGILRGDASATYGISDLSLLDGSHTPRNFAKDQSITDPSLWNTVCGGFGESCAFTLIEPGSFGVEVAQSFDPRDGLNAHRYFVFWADPKESYFCPEPWLGGPNSLNTGEGLIRLEPGESFTWTMTISIV